MMGAKRVFVVVLTGLIICSVVSSAFGIDLYFETDVHDPATIHKDGDTYWTFCTGDGIPGRYSPDLLSWYHANETVFPIGTCPEWVDDYVTGFDGNFWAPDLIKMNGKYYLYYSCFNRPKRGDDYYFESAIGVCRSDSLNNPDWEDLGMVISSQTEPTSSGGHPVNCIDPGLFRDEDDNVWMVFGSHYGGIFAVQIDPNTGKRTNSTRYPVCGNNGHWNEYEGAQAIYMNGYYYLFVNLGECCAGDDSTYYIIVGRSDSPTGPYVDKNGNDLWNYGGTTVLDTDGKFIGPGHFGYYDNNGQDLVSIHYYDDDSSQGDGWPSRLDLLEMSFDNDDWPILSRNFTIPGASVPTPVNAGLEDGDTRRIMIRHSDKVLDVERDWSGDPESGDGVNVQQNTNLNDDTQKWVFNKVDEPVDGDYYWIIRAAHSTSYAIDIENFSPTDGTNAALWSYWGGNCQQVRFKDVGDGWYQIVARHSSKCLQIDNGSTADGANAEQWRSDVSRYYQHFRFDGGADTTPPAAPTGLSATAGNQTAYLDWDDNSESDLSGYNVYRSETSGDNYSQINSSLVGSSDYTDNSVSNGNTYYYVVTAVDASSNESNNSNEASAFPDYQDCVDVQASGYGLLVDINGDCYVNFLDIKLMANYWLNTNCSELDDCEGADIEPADGTVDFDDYSDVASSWMQCNDPEDSNCTQNW